MTDSDDRTQIVGADGVADPAAGPMPIGRLICSNPSMLDDRVGAEIVLTGEAVTVGRSTEANVRIRSASVSRVHARIYPGAGFWGIKDLNSSNGIKINGETVSQGWMRNGDSVTIGKVGYAFTQESRAPQPEQPSFTETIVSDRTLFVGQDTSAASALLKSTAAATGPKAAAEAEPRTEPSRTERSATTSTGEQQSRSDDGKRSRSGLPTVKIALGGAALVVLVIAGYFLLLKDSGLQEAVERTEHAISRFIARDERRGVLKDDAQVQQMAELEAMRDELEPVVSANPDAVAPRMLLTTVGFLEFSRKFGDAMREQNISLARRELAVLKAEIDADDISGAADGNDETAQRYRQIRDLMELARAALELKTFVGEYPSPGSDGEKPSAEGLEKVMDARQRFATLKRQHNLAVTVTYPYFGRGIAQVTDSDLSLLDRWQRATK